MKRYSKIICSLFATLLITSCANKVLDIKDLGSYSPDQVWGDEKLVNAYLASIYSGSFGGWPVGSGDKTDETAGFSQRDAIAPASGSYKSWNYSIVYRLNTMLKEIDGGTLSDEIKNPLKGQALFLRAYHYFSMVLHHGGVPYITKVQQQSDLDLNVTRNSTAECFDFMIADINAAIGLLPAQYKGNDYGKIDGSFALAFKAKVLMYKASALFNSTSLYANSYVNEAYLANKDAYETLKARGYDLAAEFNDAFNVDGNKEAVFATVYQVPDKMDARNETYTRPLSESSGGTGSDQPVWNLVSAYPMLDGKAPGESSQYAYDMQTYWLNRDPRMEKTIAINGSVFECSGKKGRRQYNVLNIGNKDDAMGFGASFDRTGFFPRKGLSPELPFAERTRSGKDYSVMRFAEVMCNYAETAIAAAQPDVVYDVIKQLRKRAGIEAGADDLYGLKAGMSNDELRLALLNEKLIEFTFEDQRFWDLRRNRMLYLIDGIRKPGLEGEYNGTINDEVHEKANKYLLLPGDFKYKVQELYLSTTDKINHIGTEFYIFPIKISSMEQNPNLKQNIGWGDGTFNPYLD